MASDERCGRCGEILESGVIPDRCPACDAIILHVKDELTPAEDHVSGLVSASDGTEKAYFESERKGRVVGVDRLDDATLSSSVAGVPPRGEENRDSVCQALVGALNALGDEWLPPEPGEGVADCIAAHARQRGRNLLIQVVNVETDPDRWRQLASDGHITDNRTVTEMAGTVREAISHKAEHLQTSEARRGVTLALDATVFPAAAFNDVVLSFERRDGAWASGLGFAGIWVVGPLAKLVKRLA